MSWESGESQHQSDDDDLDSPETDRGENPSGSHEEVDSTIGHSLSEYEETLDDHEEETHAKPSQLDESTIESTSGNGGGNFESSEEHLQEESNAAQEAEKDDHTIASSLGEYEETLNENKEDIEEEPNQQALNATEFEQDAGETGRDSPEDAYSQEAGTTTHEDEKGDDSLTSSLGEYEETIDAAPSSTEATSEPEEHGATSAEPDQVGDSESENQSNDTPNAQDVRTDAIESAEARERVEPESHQSENQEPDHNKTESHAENQQVDPHVEGEARGRQGESHERNHEDLPLKLSDDPEAFGGKNSEQLAELGILPEHDEAKLDENTTLRFDASEGLSIVHGEQHYEIATVEHDRIGELDFHRYKTEQGEEFLHIPDQEKLVPPNETSWYALPSNTEVYLDKEYKHELLEAAIDKAGGQAALRQELHQRGTEIENTYLYRHLHDLADGMQADKLISILDYAGRDLDEANSHVTAIGHCRAIENPNLPFDLNNKDGARIVGARFSDGTNCAPEGRGPRFDYGNNDAEQRNRIIESLRNVFGGANILEKERDNGEVTMVRTSTDIIGHTLKRAGGITGDITEQNPHIPTWIQQGSKELKHEWLVQAFGDEGFVWPHRGKVCITRAIEASSILTEDMRQRLDQMNWKDKSSQGKFIEGFRTCDDLSADIHQVIRSHPPNLLVEEKNMLKDFGMEMDIYPSEIHRGKYGDFSVQWVLQTETRDDSRHFLKEIGFPQERKQKELLSALRLDR